MNVFKTLVLLSILQLNMIICCAQIDPSKAPTLNQIIPSSPNAASLGAYGESQVSLYTGQADITIPLYNIQTKGLNIPISLTYNPSGVKVESVASWVGLQWSLNAGGVITRQLVGMPDESPSGYSQNYPREQMSTFLAGGMTDAIATDYMSYLISGQIDAEPDIFFFNYPNGVGKFFYGFDGIIHEAPVKKNKIEWVMVNGKSGWKISDHSGHEYYFFDREETSFVSTTKAGAQTSVGISPISNQTFDSSWYLSQILDKNSGESIYFDYEGFSYTQRSIGSRTKYIVFATDSPCGNTSGESYSITTVSALRVKKIRFPGGYVDFVAGDTREDLPGDQVLSQVLVKNLKDEIISSFNFSYHYTNSSDSPYGIQYGKRLFLDKVSIGNGELGNYTFAYNSIDLPHRLSYNQDHWGYFNNAHNNDLFTPSDYYFNDIQNTYVFIPGADKQIDTTYSQAAVLQKIVYPTGGTTTLTYENNTVNALPADFDLKYTDKNFVLNGNSYNEIYFEKTFVIDGDFLNSGGVFAKLSGDFGCAGNSFSCPDVKLIYQDNSSIQINRASYGKTFFLKKGTYKVTADYTFISDPQALIQNLRFVLTWPESYRENPLTAHNIKVGGLRVKKIEKFDPSSNQTYIKRYAYSKFNTSNESSGTITSVPYYKYRLRSNYGQDGSTNGCSWLCVTAVSNTGLGTTNGNPVGYSEITEYIDNDGLLGKKEYVYAPTIYSQAINRLPFPPTDNLDFFNGMLIKEQSYAFKSSTYILLKEVNHNYGKYNLPGANYGLGLKAALNTYSPTQKLSEFNKEVYNISTGWNHLESTQTKIYDGADILTSQVNYTQNLNNFLNSQIQQINSKGLNALEIIKYPDDYNNGTYGADLLKTKSIDDAVLEKSVYIDNLLVSKEANTYTNFDVLVKPSKSSVFSIPGNVMEDRIDFTNYDKKGNLLEQSFVNGSKTSYLWSYNNQYPICEIKNANYATIESILGGPTAVSSFAAANPTDAEVNTLIDILKKSDLLKDALITSYTYKPLVGMTSQTDPKGMTTYYEYDEFQRLKNVKDQNGNILKNNTYHYKN